MSTEQAPEPIHVPVEGGSLAVHDLTPGSPPGAPVVLAVHGITANALSWAVVAREVAGRARVLAPDLRGRASSRDVDGPWGLATHVDDLVAVLDAVDARSAVVAGHSMGAFVAALLAARHPERVSRLVLVDGGVGFPAPEGTDLDAVLQAVIGPAMQRLSMRFDSADDYLDFWREHPALGPLLDSPAGPDPEAYLRHDLVDDGSGGFRSSCRLDAVRADGKDVLADAEVLSALAGSVAPAVLLWAPRGLLDEPQGLYDEQRLAAAKLPGRVAVRRVDDTNHYSVLLAGTGVRAVSDAVLEAVGAG